MKNILSAFACGIFLLFIVGVVLTQTNITGMNFVQNPNTVTLLCYSKSAAAITGTGADANLFPVCTLPTGILVGGKGLHMTIVSNHSTGSASVAYKVIVNGSTTIAYCTNAFAAQVQVGYADFMNDAASQTSNAVWASCIVAGSATGTLFATSGATTTGAVTLQPTFNVANTDAVTPDAFKVELVQ